MAITHRQKYTFSDGSGTPIAYEVAQSGSVAANLDATVPGGTGNQAFAISLDASAMVSLYLVASQAATVRTNGTDEVQLLTPGGSIDPTDHFYLTFGGQDTSPMDFAALPAATIQAALVALSTIGADNVAVTGPDGGPWSVTFTGALGLTNVAALTATVATIASATLTITTPTPGVAPSQTIALAAGVPVSWHSDADWANPISADVTKLSVSVAGSATCQVKLRALSA